MIARTTKICNKLGLHARAASKLVGVAQEFGASIELTLGDKLANGKSIMSVLMLQATINTELEVRADGEDEEEAVNAVVSLIEDRFGEDE